ncbi:hypothetical protein [uncultured Corynebacterium sp.]|uniref:hypothetical protein n=1 Tax=uncultured Corynebacterium sp. TaxID=159447 RepID=UPI0025E71028|nr:hypothetical protein [uncultured Corynebacterium sp.]
MHDAPTPRQPDDDDPLRHLERKDYSWRPALKYAAAVVGATFLTAIILGVASAIIGGPNCDDGSHVFICSRAFELAFPLVPGAVSLIGALGGFYMTYVRWKNFGNWRPWLAMCWVLMPWTLAWMTSTFSIAMFGVEGGIPQ